VDANGNTKTVSAVNLTASITTAGANGLDAGSEAADAWYAVWVSDNGTTTSALLSLSATAPALPPGYTYKCRVGWVRNDGSSNLFRTRQCGRETQYLIGTNPTAGRRLANGTLGDINTPTWSSVAVGAFVPPTAAVIRVATNPTNAGVAMTAPNNSYGAWTNTTNAPPVVAQVGTASASSAAVAALLLESTNIYVASNVAANWYALGWEDNL
jgi:hypothetical protein